MKNIFEHPGEHHKAALEQEKGIGDHDDNLYDQDEDGAGQRIDAATGKWIDNSTDEKPVGYAAIDPSEHGGKDALGPVNDDDDAAAHWLKEHDKAA
jgi:hypothetical protein